MWFAPAVLLLKLQSDGFVLICFHVKPNEFIEMIDAISSEVHRSSKRIPVTNYSFCVKILTKNDFYRTILRVGADIVADAPSMITWAINDD